MVIAGCWVLFSLRVLTFVFLGAILASLVTVNPNAVIVAFAHLLFNICGIVIWWPLQKVPVSLAQRFADRAAKNRVFPFVYILVMFFVVPLIIIFTLN